MPDNDQPEHEKDLDLQFHAFPFFQSEKLFCNTNEPCCNTDQLTYAEIRKLATHNLGVSLNIPLSLMENYNTNYAGSALIVRSAFSEATTPREPGSIDQTF